MSDTTPPSGPADETTDEPVFITAASVEDPEGQVELAEHHGEILMRVNGDPSGKVLTFTKAELAAFIAGCKAGEFDDIGQPLADADAGADAEAAGSQPGAS